MHWTFQTNLCDDEYQDTETAIEDFLLKTDSFIKISDLIERLDGMKKNDSEWISYMGNTSNDNFRYFIVR